MGRRTHLLFGIIFATFYLGKGCQIDGVTNWLIPISESVVDTFRGTVYNRSTSNIEGINSINFFEGLNNGPYLDITFTDSRLNIVTNDAFADYEEKETAVSFSFTIVFRCTGGTTSTLVFLMNVIDTNNNAPQFMPSSNYEFTIAPPIPPGFLVTGCLNDITVRDIDLTTQRIDYEIEDNQYFEIEYDATSTVPKEFKATLKSTTFIRSIPEPITLRITATDVDLTGDPRLSTSATIRIIGDSEFEFPEEPVFSQPFYLANYTEDHRLIVHDTITLLQGYDDQVSFTLEGEHSSNFGLVANENEISIVVETQLPEEVLMNTQMFLVVKAEREYTTGDTATVIVQLPEEVSLEFERAHYEGSIENNVLQLSPLTLSQGYDASSLTVNVISEYSSYFSVDVQVSQITLTMSPLPDNIIEEHNYIPLQVLAFTNSSSASAIITLEIIKDDNVTPVFNKPIFTGTYDSATGLSIEQIIISQGYDETVSVNLEGDHASYFQIVQLGSAITLTSSSIPPEIFSEQRILLSVEAAKPRTVGANAAVVIALPAARELRFEAPTYRGSLRDNELILETIELSVGYEENVNFALTGDLASYFTTVHNQNQVNILLTTVLPADFITANKNIILILTASGLNADPYSATILLEILKDDLTTPIFNQMIYYGNYSGTFDIEIENINLAQGYDDSVTFRIEGEHAPYFGISNTQNSVTVHLRSAIPEELMFNEKVLSFIIRAEKDLTIGANAAILIRFPTEFTEFTVMRFGQKNYIGSIQDNIFSLENIILDTGFTDGIEFTLTGDYSSYFSMTNTTDTVSISLLNSLPDEIVENNSFFVMNLEAQRDRAISTFTSIIISIIKEDIIPPVFSEPFYSGVYTEEIGLRFDDEISLALGYDETVTYTLEGEGSALFLVVHNENFVTLFVRDFITETILQNNNQFLFSLVANKPNAVSGRSAIFIDLPKDVPDQIILRFEQSSYVGSIHNGELQIPTITLSGNHSEAIHVNMIGEYVSYFTLSMVNNIIIIEANGIPEQVINENIYFIFELEAIYPEAVTGYTTLVIEILKDAEPEILTPLFERAYYTGEYSDENGLIFTDNMKLIQGFNESVTFSLSGDDAQWFMLVENLENSLSLAVKPDSEPQTTDRSKFIFSILAEKPGSLPGHAAVVLSITDMSTVIPLRFLRDFYTGSIENSNLTLEAIRLEDGYLTNANYSLLGDYSNYFQLTEQDGIFTLQLISVLPTEVEANNILVFTLEAQAANNRAHTTIVFELITSIDSDVTLAFEETYYVGSYSEASGLNFYEQIRLKDETNTTAQFSLSGGDSQWFELEETSSSILLTLPNPIPAAVLANKPHLIFVISAQRVGSTTASATIVITFNDEYTENSVLGFDRITYVGTIENNIADIQPITLNEGFTQDVTFTLHGEMSNYFGITSEGAVVNIVLETAIPEESIPANYFTWLQILASAPPAITAHATILVEFERQNASTAVELKFDKPFYTGNYTEVNGLTFVNPISLSEGYDENVLFTLEEGDSQWFELEKTGNSILLTLPNPIPPAVLANNQHLICVISAQRVGSTTASATIVISLKDDYIENNVLGFDRITYVGSIENNIADIQPITLNEGFTQDVTFTLHGEMSNYFGITSEGAVVNIVLETAIPEESIPVNYFTWLQILASAPPAITAHATILVEFGRQNASTAVELKFDKPFYTGNYTEVNGLTFVNPISLSEGYDENVLFTLEEGDSQWFELEKTGNSILLTLPNPIPAAVLANNQHLICIISAQRVGSTTASATIVISLKDDYIENNVLGFDRITYVGSIENNIADIQPITLNEGFTQDVTFTLHGEMSNYFGITSEGAVVNIFLETAIPEESIPANYFTWLQILASAPPAITAHATILVEFGRQNASTAVELKFDKPFYTGNYTEVNGLTFVNPISLSEGYDENVLFTLEEGDYQWFELEKTGNSILLTLPNPIPAAVLANNQHLICIISAQRVGSMTASATIVISLKDDYIENNVLGFDRITYVGSIENNIADIQPITLNEGFTPNVTFTLHGEMSNYFGITSEGAVVNIVLETAIPEESIPANYFTWLQILASAPPAITAHATILVEFGRQNASTSVELKFDKPFYTGNYTEVNGLTFVNPISLSEGYDENVLFTLEEGDSQWFELEKTGNSILLTLPNPIPPAVLANNQHLICVISAQRVGSTTASATIVISLKDDYIENNVLGFDRITYVGSIENNIADIQPITLNEGFTQDVTFTLHGEMSNYFVITSEGAVVNIVLETAIPEESIPANYFTWLQILASAPPAITAHATILVEFGRQNASTAVELKFDKPFYTGNYTEVNGLTFVNPISLSEGYDENVLFTLEEGDSQWFELEKTGNSILLTLPNPIPAAVLANNQHLICIISAQRVGSTTASATIVISLKDDYIENNVLGFDRITYVGSIENNIADIQPITLNEGFTQNVTFTLHGEMSNYFGITSEGAVVNVVLETAIPEESIPANYFTWLQILASAPPAITAHATILVEFGRQNASTSVELKFDKPFYTGNYTEVNGLTFVNPISLSEGYDENVLFTLEEGDSQWFELEKTGNSILLTLPNPIPAAVLANNQHLICVISAQRVGSTTASATIVISLKDDYIENNVLGFDRITYVGSIENNVADIQPITLNEGFTQDVTFTLHGEMSNYFGITSEGAVVNIVLETAIPEESIPANYFTWLQILASALPAITAHATILVEFGRQNASTAVELKFDKPFYTGNYTEVNGLTFVNPISLSEGYDENVLFTLEEGDSQWFELEKTGNSILLTLPNPIPAAVLANNQHLICVISAQRVGSTTASATIVISLKDDYIENNVLGFDRITYVGSIENNIADIQSITLNEGFTQDVTFTLHGEMSNYFGITSEGAVVNIVLETAIPEESIPANYFTWLQILASAPPAITAHATILVEFGRQNASTAVELKFDKPFYTGNYTEVNGLTFVNPISLSEGYDENVLFTLEEGDSQWFELEKTGNSILLTLPNPIPAAVLANNQHLICVISAQRVGSTTASATIVISLKDDFIENNVLGFDRITYVGSIENNIADIQPITLNEGFTQDVTFTLHGEMSNYFGITSEGAVVNIVLETAIPEESIPANYFTWLQILASAPPAITAHATILVEFGRQNASTAVELKFDKPFYTGNYTEVNGLTFVNPISLSEGYDENVLFTLDGEHSLWFSIVVNDNSVLLTLATPIPNDVLASHNNLVFVIKAQKPGSSFATATIVVSLDDATDSQDDVTFEKVLYEGLIQLGVVQHEPINISGFTGTNVQLFGEYASAFESRVSNGVVTIQGSGTVTLPVTVTLVVLELHADGASAVLLLNIIESETPVLPSVSFRSPTYALRVGDDQTGVIGQVEAIADNGESITYSLVLDNAHLLSRIYINNEGEIHLSAPAVSGEYTIQVVATTIITQVSGFASVYLSVETITTCGDNDIVIPPLIILNRDEEESHNNLVVLNGTQYDGCLYTLLNHWPADQTWLYVDDNGLHTRAIDREHESIAFMALSQVQVELILHCDSDLTTRTKRSIESDTANWLGPYDYGTKNWILTDTIPYNSRRSFVNLIVNDINDNTPIFVGKENEPIVVGYPVPELEDTVLPRSLAELEATDADIGENAALLYWSSEPELAVAPLTGFVHVRDGALLDHDMRFTVNATDRNGEGLTGSIVLQVKLLDVTNIIVVTVRDAFLDDEETILANLSTAVGYDVKVLRSTVISDGVEDVTSRKKREAINVPSTVLQLYVYGLIEREVVAIEQLITDINDNAEAIHIASTLSLEDHLEGQEICVIPGRDVGLLASTITLSILLFILIVLIVLWFCRKRIWRKNYEEFSDDSSLASRNDSLSQSLKPESSTKPRLNIEELKRSERRLQEMLDAPVRDIVVEPPIEKIEVPLESKVDMTHIDPRAPIVIQSIDKLKDSVDESSSDDEFGEVQKAKKRKSVVTFNENVEKIIHVDDSEDANPEREYEVYKL